jgi:hypothetical protein
MSLILLRVLGLSIALSGIRKARLLKSHPAVDCPVSARKDPKALRLRQAQRGRGAGIMTADGSAIWLGHVKWDMSV